MDFQREFKVMVEHLILFPVLVLLALLLPTPAKADLFFSEYVAYYDAKWPPNMIQTGRGI